MSRNIMQVFEWKKMSTNPPTESCNILFIIKGWEDTILRGRFDKSTPMVVYQEGEDETEWQVSDVSYWAKKPLPPQED